MKLLAREGGVVFRRDGEIRKELEDGGFEVISREERGRDVARTWLLIAERSFRVLGSKDVFFTAIKVGCRRPFLMLTPLLAWLLYQSGALRYGIWVLEKRARRS